MRRSQRLLLWYLSAASLVWPVAAQTTPGLIKRTPETVEQMNRSERQVTLDVQVTDISGKPVSGLTQQNLTLVDNGRQRPLTSFREISGGSGTPPVAVILLLDTTNASFQDVVIARQGMEQFFRQNGGHLELPVSIVLLADTGVKIGKASQDGNSLAEDLKKLPTPMRVLGNAQGGNGAEDRLQRSIRAVQLLSTYEATRPGRKLLIWVGPGWPLLSRSTATVSPQEQRRYFDSIVNVTTNLRRAHITLYSVAPLNLAQISGTNPLFYQAYLKGVDNPTQADSANLAVQVLAIHSGGLALGESGDLAGAIGRCLSDGKDYYEMSFDVADNDGGIHYRALQVSVDRPGAVARTSTAYYAGLAQATSGLRAEIPAESTVPTAPVASPSAPRTLATEARRVVVDVTVRDKNGIPLKGLSSSDFSLREDNLPQQIASVEEHGASESVIAAPPDRSRSAALAEATAADAIVASNQPPAGSIWNVLLIDLFNTPNEDRGRLQSQVEQFLKQLPEHEPIALVTMLRQLKIETSFQDGAGAAYRYLHKHGLGALDASTPADLIGRTDAEQPNADTTGSAIRNQANVDVDQQADRAQTTLDCFSALARWLTPYPGRKNVFWLSGGFPLLGQPFGLAGYNLNTPDLGPETKGGHALPMQQKTDKELESARVAIYPVDARGVAAPDIAGVSTADTPFVASVGIAARKDNNLVTARRSEMLEIASATGGIAQFNNNIAQALSDDFNQANGYYTVAYTPPDKEWKGAYHRIQVSVDKPGAQLVYREGYYAGNFERASRSTPEQFRDDLELNSPSAFGVRFAAKITTSGQLVTADYTVEPRTVDFRTDQSGKFLADVDFAIVEYDAKGKVLEKSLIRLSDALTAEQRAQLFSTTLSAKQTISLKAGATHLVLGVRDQTSGRFGKIEVSLSQR